MQVWQTSDTYLEDFHARAGEGWHHTKWDFRNVISASRDKVHIDLQFTRYRADDSVLGSFRSIWVITLIGGRWAAHAVALRGCAFVLLGEQRPPDLLLVDLHRRDRPPIRTLR